MSLIDTPKISEILTEEFMEPLGISAYRLAKDIHVPISRIQEILKDKRAISVDTSLRLSKTAFLHFFGYIIFYFACC